MDKANKIEGCTCGLCFAGRDEHGNVDYGNEWDGTTYVARECPVARQAVALGKSIDAANLEGHFKVRS